MCDNNKMIEYMMDVNYGVEFEENDMIGGGERSISDRPNGGFPPLFLMDELQDNNIFENIILKSKKFKDKNYYHREPDISHQRSTKIVSLQDLKLRLRSMS